MIPSRSPRARGSCRSREGAYRTSTTHRSHIASTHTACNTNSHHARTRTVSLLSSNPHKPHRRVRPLLRLRGARALAIVRRRIASGAPVLRSLQLHCSCVPFDFLLIVAQIHLWQAAGSVQSVDKNMRGAARHVVELLVGVRRAVAPRPPLRCRPATQSHLLGKSSLFLHLSYGVPAVRNTGSIEGWSNTT